MGAACGVAVGDADRGCAIRPCGGIVADRSREQIGILARNADAIGGRVAPIECGGAGYSLRTIDGTAEIERGLARLACVGGHRDKNVLVVFVAGGTGFGVKFYLGGSFVQLQGVTFVTAFG